MDDIHVGVIFLLIHRMSAVFGRLRGHTLELQEGLNILHAPNETGKSTWCAFLLAMLYGVNSRERERSGFIPDKVRYAPWSGAAMRGRMDCFWGGQELTITRLSRRQTAPLGDFRAVYTGTGDTVAGLTGQNCGEALLGISREVFERSAFIRQSGLPISQDAGLERRIAALITTGDQDTSYSEAADILKKQLNRRRYHKSGQIPALEAELRELRQQLAELEQVGGLLSATHTRMEMLAERQRRLGAELAQHERWEAALQHKALAESAEALRLSEQNAAALRRQLDDACIPPTDAIARLRGAIVHLESARTALDQARAQRDEAARALLQAETAVNDSPFSGKTAEGAWASAVTVSDTKPWPLSELLPSIFLGLLLLFLCLTSAETLIDSFLFGIPLGIPAIAIPLYKNYKWKRDTASFLQKHGVSSAAELRTLAAAYKDLLRTREAAQTELDKRAAAADALYHTFSSNEQAVLREARRFAPAAFDVSAADEALRQCAQRRKALEEADAAVAEARMRYELLARQTPPAPPAGAAAPTPPLREREAVAADLAESQADLAAARSAADQLAGRLQALGDPIVLASSAGHLEKELLLLEEEHAAIRLAMETLDTANTTLQNRFSPALGQRAAEIFKELTASRYNSVVLDRAFRLCAEPAGDTVYRDAAALSAGTADQLYLAARLAVCDLVLPAEKAVPIVLDDALSNFDDTRCAAALRWLKEAAKRRQILLFSCHSREADFFAGDSEVSVQRLTDTA